MRALIQRVSNASVTVDGQVIGQIEAGLLVLVCAMQGDTEIQAQKLVDKIIRLRIFRDAAGKMNRSLADTGGSVLVVSQFTLAADTTRGNRPGYSQAAAPDLGNQLYDDVISRFKAAQIPTETGQFGADMAVALTNDGPVTIWLDVE